ncbi:MAG: glutathione S-transferase family protein [Gammaproteobacteria bacterium]|nr:glutathione S-transferase family protein [Gammaproteobacteria bacterium]
MNFYNSIGPNPQVVRTFAAERGITLDTIEVDLMAGENRQDDYLEKNPSGGLPCLELDDGSYLAEITAICEYLDEVSPGDPLMGSTPEARAESRMWTRRVDLYICEPMTNGFRYGEGLAMFKDRMTTLPEASEGLKRVASERLTWLNGLMEGKQYICGDRLTLADILLSCFLRFGKTVGQPLAESNKNLIAWADRMDARDSAKA